MAEKQGVPPSVYKNAIDLNRYSNNVAKKVVVTYNRIVLNATNELLAMDAQEYAASYRAQRLRMILGSLKTSLDGWAGDASKLMKGELTDLANVQSEFAVAQLLGQVPGADDLVRELTITPQFAQAVVETDPTDLNMVTLSDDLGEKVTGTYSLGAQQGAPITLPNGDSLGKAFRGLSEKSAQKFRLVVQDGLLTGESTPKIVRNLIGRQGGMDFGTGFEMAAGEITKKGVRQIAQAGGPYLTRMANHQIMTLVRTSVNQVSNTASQQTYRANREITDNFIFVATLDSRTSLTCATKDGKEYSYDDGPIPPLHFNCRSTTIAVPNWDALEEKYGIQRPDDDAFRMSKDGPVPAGESYGKWLYDKRLTNDKGKYLGPGPEQIEALGKKKAVYFNRLAARKGSNGDKAIRKLISTDGTEKTLDQIVKENNLRRIDVAEAAKALPEKSWYGEPLPKMKRGVTRDKTQALGRAFIKENAPEIGVWQSINKKQRNLERTIIERIERKEIQKLKSKKEVIGMLERVEALEERQRKKAEKAFGRLREKMLLTSLSEEDVKRYTSLPVFRELQPSRLKVVKEALDDYVRMFNGRGIKPKKTGIGSVSLIEGIKARAFNKGKQITIGNNRGFNKLRADLFHEITHTTERQNKWMFSWATEWRNEKAFTRLHIAGIKDGIKLIEDETQSVKRWGKKMGLALTKKGREMAAAGNIPTEGGKPKFMLQTLYPRGGYKSHERVVLDKYMSPYMGKVYLNNTTEVWTMGIEKFADKSGVGMYELWKAHPDLFEMIVGLSQS